MEKEKEIKQFIADLVLMKAKAGELGLYKTMHKLEEPIGEVGYEFAELLNKK